MQTFLPYADFTLTAQCLDRQRLGKQRIECKQILFALTKPNYGWASHPATLMWRNHEYALCLYASAICTEWLARGYIDNQLPFFKEYLSCNTPTPAPSWLGHEPFHASHRAALLYKSPVHYAQFGWSEQPSLNYYWPTKEVDSHDQR